MRPDDSNQQLLQWLRSTVVNSVREGVDDLTMRQLAVMMTTYMDKTPQTVRGLANTLQISRPAISRALDRLGEYGLTRRQTDPLDRRSIVVRRTRKGAERMQQLRNLMPAFPEPAGAPGGGAVDAASNLDPEHEDADAAHPARR